VLVWPCVPLSTVPPAQPSGRPPGRHLGQLESDGVGRSPRARECLPRAKSGGFMAIRKPHKDMNLDDVRALVRSVREEGLRIQRHYKKLEEEYSDWEDRVWKLDQILLDMEEKTGLTKIEIQKDTDNEYVPDELFESEKDNSVEVDWGDLD